MSRTSVRVGIALAVAFAAVPGAFTLSRGAAAPTPAAPAVDSAIIKAYRWRSVGPERGGRSIATSGVKGQPKVGYFGATGGGLWKTTDGGETWSPVTDGQTQQRLRRRGGRVGVGSEHPVHRHGRVLHSRRHPAWRRRLQVHRRRQDVDARWLRQLRCDLSHPNPSDEPEHRVRRRLRKVRREQRRARCVQEHRRRHRPGARCCTRDRRPAASTFRSTRPIRT